MKSIASMTTGGYTGDVKRRPGTLSTNVNLQFPMLARSFLPPLLATLFLWRTSPNDISLLQWFAALVLLFLSWASYCKWRVQKQRDIPLFSMISFIFWLYYALPLFWGTRLAVSLWTSGETISDSAVSGAMVMAALGVFSIWLGIKSGIGRRWSPPIVPDIPHSHPRHWSASILLANFNLSERVARVLPSGSRLRCRHRSSVARLSTCHKRRETLETPSSPPPLLIVQSRGYGFESLIPCY